MARKVDPDMRRRILDLCHKGLSVRAIGKEVGVDFGTVSHVAREEGFRFSEERVSRTREATATRVKRLKEQRLDLAEQLLADAFRTRARMWDEHQVYERGPQGMVLVTLPMPTIKDQRDGYHTVEAQINAHDKLMAGIVDSTNQARVSMVEQLAEGLRAARKLLPDNPDAEPEQPGGDTEQPDGEEAGEK